MTQLADARFQAALSDRYIFDRVLGRGGMGTVFLARDVKHGRQIAIKALSPEVVADVGERQFSREIRVTAQLQHPHILPLIDSGKAADSLYYVMPYLKAGSLRDLLNEKKRLSVAEALNIVSDVAEALEHAHESGLIHCDIKPENILMSAGHAVLADFGVARAQHVEGRPWRAMVDSSGGTPAYVSPEQATGDHLDARSDLYSLACVLYEMLTGQAPFAGDSDQATIAHRFTKPVPRIDELVRGVPSGISLAVAKAMSVNPQMRFPSVGRFMDAVGSEYGTPASVMTRSSRRWSERLGILGFRLVHRFQSMAGSKQGLKGRAGNALGA